MRSNCKQDHISSAMMIIWWINTKYKNLQFICWLDVFNVSLIRPENSILTTYLITKTRNVHFFDFHSQNPLIPNQFHVCEKFWLGLKSLFCEFMFIVIKHDDEQWSSHKTGFYSRLRISISVFCWHHSKFML